MARPPRIESRELVQQIGVVRPNPVGESGLLAAGRMLGQFAGEVAQREEAEQKAIDDAILSRVSTDARMRAAEIAQAADGDPHEFEAVFGGYLKKTVGGLDERIRGTASQDLERIAAGQYVSMISTETERNRVLHDDQLKSAAEGFQNELLSGAYAGRFDVAESQATLRYIETMNARVASGFISRARADRLIETTQAEARGNLYLAANRQTYEAEGFLPALTELQDLLMRDDSIPPEVRETLVNKGQAWLNDQVQIQNLREAQTTKAITERRETVMGTAETMLVNGELTQEWINQQAGVLTADQRKSLRIAIQGDATHVDDPQAVSDLTSRMYAGEDIQADALRYHREGRLTNPQLSSFLSRNRELSRSEGPKSEYERQRSRIAQVLNPDFLGSGTGANIRQAEALYMLDKFKDEAPADKPRTDEEIAAKGNEIVERFSIVEATELLSTLPTPLFFVGSRTEPNIAATEMALRKALDAGQISQEEAEREALLIQRWNDAMRIQQRAAAAKAAKDANK